MFARIRTQLIEIPWVEDFWAYKCWASWSRVRCILESNFKLCEEDGSSWRQKAKIRTRLVGYNWQTNWRLVASKNQRVKLRRYDWKVNDRST